MRLAISGTAHSGKTTLLKSFLHTWRNYESPSTSYRDILKEKELDHSKGTTPKTQTVILDHLVDTVQGYKIDDNVIYDRCPLDALVYTLWAHEKGIKDFDKEFVTNQIAMSDWVNDVVDSQQGTDVDSVCAGRKAPSDPDTEPTYCDNAMF